MTILSKKTITFIVVLLITIAATGCQQEDPLSPGQPGTERFSTTDGIKTLKFKDGYRPLQKTVVASKWITIQDGGVITLQYGSELDARGSFLYGVKENSPSEIYKIDPADVANPVYMGQLAFKTRAIAIQPKIDPIEPPSEPAEELRVLFVANDASALSQAETIRIQLMESWGFTVNPISASASQTEFNDAVLNNDVAFIFEGINDADLNTKLVQTSIGIVSEEVRLIDEFGIASNYVWAYSNFLNILDASHYITSAFSSTAVAMFTTNLAVPYFSQYFAPGLSDLGSYSSYYGPSLVTLEEGASLYGGGTAAGRRVQLPMGNYGYDFSLLSNDGKTLLRRSFEWAAHKEGFNPGGSSPLPGSGLVYYVAKDKVGDIYRVATWDPTSGINTILPVGTTIRPSDKLTFGPDGRLYGVNKDHSDEIYTINTATGEWTLLTELNQQLSDKGDLAFGPDGTFYNTDDKHLYRIDLSTNTLIHIAQLPKDHVSGLGFLRNGACYFSRDNGELFTLDETTGNGAYLGDTNIDKLHDLTSYVGEVELFYARVTLTIPPASISEDAEVTVSLNSNEILGGVSVTFEPHGVTFSMPAELDIVASGVDFAGVDLNLVDVFYDNEEDGIWDRMPKDELIIDELTGKVVVKKAKLPHFSRYAVGME